MEQRVTLGSERFVQSQVLRAALAAATVLLVIVSPAITLASRWNVLGMLVAGPAAFISAYLAAGKRWRLEENYAVPQSPRWPELSREARVKGVDLAWLMKLPRPHLPPLPSPARTFLVVGFIGICVAFLASLITALVDSKWAATGAEYSAQLVYVALVLLQLHLDKSEAQRLAGHRAQIVGVAIDELAAYELRECAARWIRDQESRWYDEAERHCIARTRQRIGAADGEPFVLRHPHDQWLRVEDLPPDVHHLTCLLVVPDRFVAARRGLSISLHATSRAEALAGAAGQVATHEEGVEEREIYLRDIAGIDYQSRDAELYVPSINAEHGPGRAPAARRAVKAVRVGELVLMLSGGDALKYTTLEEGGRSALNAVRAAVRSAKIRV